MPPEAVACIECHRATNPGIFDDWARSRHTSANITCLDCHSDSWINDFYEGLDKAVQEYKDVYFKPAKAKIDELYDKSLLDKTKYFDEHLELQFYELWHHEGRRARMGTMMMAPDYAWWHGFYECKARYNVIMEEAYIYPNYLNATGGYDEAGRNIRQAVMTAGCRPPWPPRRGDRQPLAIERNRRKRHYDKSEAECIQWLRMN